MLICVLVAWTTQGSLWKLKKSLNLNQARNYNSEIGHRVLLYSEYLCRLYILYCRDQGPPHVSFLNFYMVMYLFFLIIINTYWSLVSNLVRRCLYTKKIICNFRILVYCKGIKRIIFWNLTVVYISNFVKHSFSREYLYIIPK